MGRRALWLALALAVGLGILLALRPEGSLTPEDQLIDLALPDDRPLRIVVMGTSLTANYDWSSALEQSLDCLPNGASVVTVAKAGAGIRWGSSQAPTVARHFPDLVLIEFAINDADLIDGVRLATAKTLHAELIAALRTLDPAPALVLMTMSPAEGPRGWLRYWLADHYAQYRAIATKQDVGLLDLYPRWLGLEDRGLRADGLHPDPLVAAEIIVPVMTQFVADLVATPCGETDQ